MQDFPAIRITVKLLLIVAMAIQPVAPCFAGLDGRTECRASSSFSCRGCGCCHVPSADDLCCCCSTPPDAKREEPSCCGGKDEAAAEQESSAEQIASSSASQVFPVDSSRQLRSMCMCGADSHPLSDSSPRSRISENRTSVPLRCADLDGIDRELGMSRAPNRPGADGFGLAHFSQVLLCIWRL